MLQKTRIPEICQRDRFIRQAVKSGLVLTLASEEMASVPSQKYPGQTVQLFWSNPAEARRWAEALTGASDLQELSLEAFAADILPGLAAADGLAGTDWVADPIEAEIDPLDLRLRMQMAALDRHLEGIIATGKVFIAATKDGPALETIAKRAGEARRLPVFASRAAADAWCEGRAETWTTVDPVADFAASTLPWAAARGYAVALAPISRAGLVEIASDDLAGRLARHLGVVPVSGATKS